MGTRLVLIVAMAVLSAGALAGAPDAQQPTVFRARADLVEVDVVVHGKDGSFVGDLSAGDFVVEEDGRPQPIEQFYLHLGGAIASQQPATPRNGEAVTFPAAAAPRVFVVVFDDEHLTPAGFKRTQAAARSLFSEHFRSGDVGGVVSRGRMANDRLSSDREEILRAVKDAQPDPIKNSRRLEEQQWPRLTEMEAVRITLNRDQMVFAEARRRACDDDPELCRRIDPEPSIRSKAAQMAQLAQVESANILRTLTALMSGLAKMPGRKSILLMSDGFVADSQWPVVRDAVSLAARANTRIYTLDARGLERGLRSVFDTGSVGSEITDTMARLLERMDFGSDSVNSLAVDSGGFVVRNTNQFDAAIARIADDSANYYVLGIKPGSAADGTFHPISVKVTRSDVAVRGRRGYIALPRPAVTETNPPPVPVVSERPEAIADIPSLTASTIGTPVEPTTVEGTIVPRAQSAAAVRMRPGGETHANALSAGSRSHDPDATAGWDA